MSTSPTRGVEGEFANWDFVKAYVKMKAAGVEVRLHVGEKMDHVYPLLPTPEGKAARKEIAEILSGW